MSNTLPDEGEKIGDGPGAMGAWSNKSLGWGVRDRLAAAQRPMATLVDQGLVNIPSSRHALVEFYSIIPARRNARHSVA